MLIERPPELFRRLFPGGLFRIPEEGNPKVYLTFDDGPIPEATPEVLDILDRFGAKATFFMVGDNARRYPDLLAEVRRRGHGVGNHTMHHLQGRRCPTGEYMEDVAQADRLLKTRLFRPPHGLLRPSQLKTLREEGYELVMYDLITRDYSRRLNEADVVRNVKRYVRPGSIIVFHDSLKSIGKLRTALPEVLQWLAEQNYEFALLPGGIPKR